MPVRLRAAAAALLPALGLAFPVQAARPAPDSFPLGVSAGSGAVCSAVRDDDDPAAQQRGAVAWSVRCRGWDATLGRLYSYDWRGPASLGPQGIWSTNLQTRAKCQPAVPVAEAGLTDARRAQCSAFGGKVAYLAYSGRRGARGVAADGFASLDDVLQTGLRVIAGAARPPKATEVLAAGSGGGDIGGLAQATAAAAASPENLRQRGYARNLAWRFSDAETDFSALAQNGAASRQVRAEALLNWALNTSNVGRFNRADLLFAEADALIGADPALRGEYLSYQALHLRNQKRFKEAIAAARAARAALTRLAPAAQIDASAPRVTQDASGAVEISAGMAAALRSRSAFTTAALDPAARVKVQVAQTYLTEATAQNALGDRAAARAALEDARALLAEPGLQRVAVWLRAQVDAELAREDEAAGRPGEARGRLALALQQLRLRSPGSPAEAYLLLELARTEAGAGDANAALRDFGAALALFKSTRGAVGASADSAQAYFDLLLARRRSDPAHVADYDERFLTAAESLGSEATADTVARLSARLDQSDSASAGLIRALEDTRRQVRLKEGEVAQMQVGAASPAARAAAQADLKALTAQAQELEAKVAAADPRYGQLVTTEVSLKTLQSKLRPGEVLVRTVLLDQAAYGLAVGPDWVQPYRIDTTRAAAEAAVTALRRPFETEGRLPPYDVAASHAFFETVFGPVRDRVLAARHLIYEPDPAMLSLPVAALAVDAKSGELIAQRRAAIRAAHGGVLSYDGVAWLGRTAETSLVVSASSFVQARGAPPSRAAKPFLGFGASVQPSPTDPKAFDTVVNHAGGADAAIEDEVCRATRMALLQLKPLGEATQELQAVGASLHAGPDADVTGAAFSDAAIVARPGLDQYRVVYFATHGLLPKPGGCLPEPSLLTSVDDAAPSSDGLLTASEILGLKLDADVVVLSACDTGGSVAGELDRSGLGGSAESLGGLTRAFIYAGARSLIVSHWQIDSEATVRLMTSMFAARQPSLGAAMREAETRLMASPDQYSHPYYWAAFTIVGDADRPMPGS